MYFEEAPDAPANLGDEVAVRRHYTTNEQGGTSGPHGRVVARVIRAWWDYETGWRFWGLVGEATRVYFSQFDIEGPKHAPTAAQVVVLEAARCAGGAEVNSEIEAFELAAAAIVATVPAVIRERVEKLVGTPSKYLDPFQQRVSAVAATISVTFALSDGTHQQRIAKVFEDLS